MQKERDYSPKFHQQFISYSPLPIHANRRFSVHLTVYGLPSNPDLRNLVNWLLTFMKTLTRDTVAHIRSFLNQNPNPEARHNTSESLQRLTWMRWSRRCQCGEGRGESTVSSSSDEIRAPVVACLRNQITAKDPQVFAKFSLCGFPSFQETP